MLFVCLFVVVRCCLLCAACKCLLSCVADVIVGVCCWCSLLGVVAGCWVLYWFLLFVVRCFGVLLVVVCYVSVVGCSMCLLCVVVC